DYQRYYQAQALFQGDAEAWKKWNKLLIRQLKAEQQADGSFPGQNGAAAATSLTLLAVALNYRFLPIYERGGVFEACAFESSPTSRVLFSVSGYAWQAPQPLRMGRRTPCYTLKTAASSPGNYAEPRIRKFYVGVRRSSRSHSTFR